MQKKHRGKTSQFPQLPATKTAKPQLTPKDRDRLALAVADILTIKGTPVSLFNKVADFISDGCGDDVRDLWKAPLIAHLIDRVNERESEGEEVSDEN